MADKYQANGQSRQDAEAARMDSHELRKKKRLKWLLYFLAFVVIQTGIITLFVMTIMKLRTPKFRVRSATIDTLDIGTNANPSFDGRMLAQLGVKNTNFGSYKFPNSTIQFTYDGTPVGEVVVPRRKAGWRTTDKFNVVVNLSSRGLPNNSQLRSEINSGTLTLRSQSRLNGKAAILWIFKKKKAVNMDCTMTIGVADRVVRDIKCK